MCPDKDASARPRQPAVVRAYLELVRNRELLDAILLDLFKNHPACKGRGLSLPKYNVLRILRGASREDGLPCQEIGRRMVTRVPDVTRLVDRLETAGLVQRQRSPEDRRVVLISLTPSALELLAALDGPIAEAHEQQFQNLTAEEVVQLEQLLRRCRGEES